MWASIEGAPQPLKRPAKGHRAFNSGFKKIRLAPAPYSLAAVLSHLWGSAFNGG